MSDRHLYRELPPSEIICTWCHNQVERNILKTSDGRIWHYGCLNTAKDTYYECLECFSTFNGVEASLEETQITSGDEFKTGHKAWCPNCGSSNVSGLTQTGVIEI